MRATLPRGLCGPASHLSPGAHPVPRSTEVSANSVEVCLQPAGRTLQGDRMDAGDGAYPGEQGFGLNDFRS